MKDKREEAIKRLTKLEKKMNLDHDVATDFENGHLTVSVELFPGLTLNHILSESSHLMDLVRDFEKRNDAVVYYCTRSLNGQFTILFVSKFQKDWREEQPDEDGYIFAAAFDLTGEFMPEGYSECGDCVFKENNGALWRIG